MDPALVIFAIESAIRLGLKINEVLLDETNSRALVLPLGSLFGDIDVGRATEYFRRHRELIEAGGVFAGLSDADLIKAYKATVEISRKLGDGDDLEKATDVVQRLQRFEQFGKTFGPKHPVRRILGTVVEIGIDYFGSHPEAMGKDSSARRIVHAFVLRLDEVDFAEGAPVEIAGDVLTAALHTLDENATLLDDDARLHALLVGITSALIAEVAGAGEDPTELVTRKNLVQRLGSAVLRGAAGAFTENLDLFLPGDGTARKVVQSTLTQVLEGVRGQPQLFTNESLELIFRSGLRAVGEHAELFSDKKVLQALIASTAQALTEPTGQQVFSSETVAAVVAGAVAAASANVGTLVDPADPHKQLLARAARAMALGLSPALGAHPALGGLLSRQQVIDLAQIVFGEVARHPEALLGGLPDDARTSALAQVIGSVAAALGDNPRRLVDGQGLQQLVRIALGTVVHNAGLLDLDRADPKTNALFRALKEVATAVATTDDPRRLVSRQGFVDLVAHVLPVVSGNLGPIVATQDPRVQRTVTQALQLANGALRGRIDGHNFPLLVRGLLVEVLWDELDLGKADQTVQAATRILRAVA